MNSEPRSTENVMWYQRGYNEGFGAMAQKMTELINTAPPPNIIVVLPPPNVVEAINTLCAVNEYHSAAIELRKWLADIKGYGGDR